MFNGVPMSSDMLDEAVEEKAIAQQNQPEEKKKVTVKIAPKKRHGKTMMGMWLVFLILKKN